MKKRIAIAYGFGRESRIMLDKFKKLNPILITCIGGKDTEDNLRLLNVEIKNLRKNYEVIVLKIEGVDSTEGFTEHWDFIEYGKKIVVKYSNTILKYFSGNKPFDILYVGRRRRDFKDRNMDIGVELPKRIRVKDVKFPLWNECKGL